MDGGTYTCPIACWDSLKYSVAELPWRKIRIGMLKIRIRYGPTVHNETAVTLTRLRSQTWIRVLHGEPRP